MCSMWYIIDLDTVDNVTTYYTYSMLANLPLQLNMATLDTVEIHRDRDQWLGYLAR